MYIYYTELKLGAFTVGGLKLYQNYFIDFINPFPGHNIPQTFIAHTSDVTTVHDDIDKIKKLNLIMLNCYIISDEINFFVILHKIYTVFNFLTPTHHHT